MALSEETVDALKKAGIKLACSAGTMVLKGAVSKAVKAVTTTSYEKHNVSGIKVVAPTKDECYLDKKEADGNSNEGALAKDDVQGQKGAVKASDSQVEANSNNAVAAQTSAKALDTEAGATEISTKALKMN